GGIPEDPVDRPGRIVEGKGIAEPGQRRGDETDRKKTETTRPLPHGASLLFLAGELLVSFARLPAKVRGIDGPAQGHCAPASAIPAHPIAQACVVLEARDGRWTAPRSLLQSSQPRWSHSVR